MKLDLNDLPQRSSWPSRLLGLSSWEIPNRTAEKVDLEYDKDKYARYLARYVEAKKTSTPEAIRQSELNLYSGTVLCISLGNDLVLMTPNKALSRLRHLLAESMRQEIEHSATVVELGCGYGYNLWALKQHFQHKRYLGGECSGNAVRLASGLFNEDPAIQVSQFNFHDQDYEILKEAQPPVVVFTSHAIEQLPESATFLQGILYYRNKISSVFHFEPVHEFYDETLLGLMRRRYAEVNDYNQDLLFQLQQRPGFIRIVHTEANVLGLQPLNPTSLIHWEFV